MLRLLAYSFCLKSLYLDLGQTFLSIQEQPQCCSSKLTDWHVACNPSCPTTSHCLNVIHRLCRVLPINTSITTQFHFVTFSTTLCHTSEKCSIQAALSSYPLHLQNGILPWWSLCLHAEQPPCVRRGRDGGRGWAWGEERKRKVLVSLHKIIHLSYSEERILMSVK